MNLHLLLRALGAGLSALLFACAASRNAESVQVLSASSQRVETVDSATAVHAACERFVHREITLSREPLPARQVAVAGSIAAFGALPEGWPVSAREGPLTVEVRRRGDSLVVRAQSDSIARTVTRSEFAELRQRRDSSVVLAAANRIVQQHDSLRQESRARSIEPRARAGGCWRWLLAGAALGLVVCLRFRRG